MSIYGTVKRQIMLMVWKCKTCGALRGYLAPETTRDRTAWLLCDGTCSGHQMHGNEFKIGKFAVDFRTA